MATRAKSRSKFNLSPAIQDELTLLLETHSTENCFEKLSDIPETLKTVTRNFKDITKQSKLLETRITELESLVSKHKPRRHDAPTPLGLDEAVEAVRSEVVRAEKYTQTGMDETAVNALNGFLENLRADRMRNSDEFQHISDELDSIQSMIVTRARKTTDNTVREEGKRALILVLLLLVPVLVNKYLGG